MSSSFGFQSQADSIEQDHGFLYSSSATLPLLVGSDDAQRQGEYETTELDEAEDPYGFGSSVVASVYLNLLRQMLNSSAFARLLLSAGLMVAVVSSRTNNTWQM